MATKKTTTTKKKVVIDKSDKNKLPESFKREWLKALRSGKYKQTTGTLCTQGKGEESLKGQFCVLGVAAHIGNVENFGYEGMIVAQGVEGGLKYTENFPKILTGTGKIPCTLAEMNDDGKSFKELANYIEKTL